MKPVGVRDVKLDGKMQRWGKLTLWCRINIRFNQQDVSPRPHLSLQSGHNLLAGLHHGVQLPGNHDGQALVFCQGELQVGASLMHDVHADLGLVSLPKLVDVLVLALLQRHVENLQRQQGGEASRAAAL